MRLATQLHIIFALGLFPTVGVISDARIQNRVIEKSDQPKKMMPANVEWDPAKFQMGDYIWSVETRDKQICQLWNTFVIPEGSKVVDARLRVIADNSCSVLLDGHKIGMSGDYHYLTEYEIKSRLFEGVHSIAIVAFNETHEAGVTIALDINFVEAAPIHVRSDSSWFVVPAEETLWMQKINCSPAWKHAVSVAPFGHPPWDRPPKRFQTIIVEPIRDLPFWTQPWFLFVVGSIASIGCLVSIFLALQLFSHRKAALLLDRERSRIARDIHDGLGAELTKLVLSCEIASNATNQSFEDSKRIDDIANFARAITGSIDELVWSINSGRDTLSAFVGYTTKYVHQFLSTTPIRCRLEVSDELPDQACNLPVRRNVLLAVKEAVNNVVKFSNARELLFSVRVKQRKLVINISDDGCGFESRQNLTSGNGLKNIRARMTDISGRGIVLSEIGKGTRVILEVPMRVIIRPEVLQSRCAEGV